MKDATPRTLQQMHRRGTRYEVALINARSGESYVIGFTARTTRLGLIALLRTRADEILETVDSDEIDFAKDDAGRWAATFGNGWVARFTGYTERTVHTLNKEGA